MEIVFSARAKKRLRAIARYLYKKKLDKPFVTAYLTKFEDWLNLVLIEFPESGQLMPQFGKGIRRVVYQKYSFVYRINGEQIEILTIYRENRP